VADEKDSPSPLTPQRALVLFHLAGEVAALPLESIQRITPMAQLSHPPSLPSAVEGILNLAGVAVPVVRLDRLLQLPAGHPTLYSMLIVLKDVSASPIALLVDRVSEILSVPESALLAVSAADSFNGCAEAEAVVRGCVIHLLSPARILLQRERESLAEFQAVAQDRLRTGNLKNYEHNVAFPGRSDRRSPLSAPEGTCGRFHPAWLITWTRTRS